MSDNLKPEHLVFCYEYLKDWNGTRAYKVAYPSEKSDNTAAANASRLLRNDKVQKYIEEAQQDIQKLAGLSILSNLEHLKGILSNPDSVERDRLKAIEVINKMLGYNAPDKSNIVVEDKTPKSKEELEKELKQLRDKRKKK